MFVVTDDEGRLCATDWEDHESRLRRLLRRHYGAQGFELRTPRRASTAANAIREYFVGDLYALGAVDTATNGTPFQRLVWDALRHIPVGRTMSYGELGDLVGRPEAARAVGLANGANPIPVVVPCHRVIGADGSLTGFGGGVERKRWLLDHESRSRALPRLGLENSSIPSRIGTGDAGR
jgi:methylated-DNA-[protein]-cysteine S-methyltransferase